MKTTLTKAEAEAILDAATKLFDLIAEAKEIPTESPEGRELYGKVVFGTLGEALPDTTLESFFDLMHKPDVSH